ncbi:MAG: branched-chain amino acid transport system permease protein [Colwellia sp.]|jgi:branched-chain amino acid transport system permease protein
MNQSSFSDQYVISRNSNASKGAALVVLLMLIILLTVPFWAGRLEQRIIIEFAYYLALAQMWNLLAGYAGLVSIGQQAFVGIGGYLLFSMAIYLNIPPILAVVLSGVITALIAIPTAFTVFRLKGAYFAIGTWVVAEVYRLGFAQVSDLGGGSGMSLPVKIIKDIASGRSEREMVMYYMALIISILSITVVYKLLRSKYGLSLTAIRDSEVASDSLGVNIFKTKLFVYVLTAGFTGMIGALIFLQKLRISPDSAFSLQDWTGAVIFIVVIGGIGTIEGPIIGTLIYFLIRGLLADYGSIYMIVLGVSAVLVMLKAPSGIWGLVSKKYDLHLFPVRRVLLKK